MNSYANFHIIFRQIKTFFSRNRIYASLSSHAHWFNIFYNFFSHSFHFFQAFSTSCHRSQNLMNKNCSSDSSSASSVCGIFNCYIIIYDNIINIYSFHLGHIFCHFKIHDISSVIFNNHKYTLTRISKFYSFQNLVWSWRCKNFSTNCTIKHSIANISSMSRLMTTSTARN